MIRHTLLKGWTCPFPEVPRLRRVYCCGRHNTISPIPTAIYGQLYASLDPRTIQWLYKQLDAMVDVTRTVPQVRSPINHSHTIQWLAKKCPILCTPTYRCTNGVVCFFLKLFWDVCCSGSASCNQNQQACPILWRSIVRLPPGKMNLDHAEKNIPGKISGVRKI